MPGGWLLAKAQAHCPGRFVSNFKSISLLSAPCCDDEREKESLKFRKQKGSRPVLRYCLETQSFSD
jgi:hypothetical protein